MVFPPVVAERHTAVNHAFIRNRIEAGDVLDFAAEGMSQHGVSGRSIHRYASGVEIRRLVNKQTHLKHKALI
jgi:hypothetical protein